MRGSSGAPDSPATWSECRPAQVSTRSAVSSPWPGLTRIGSPRRGRPVTGRPVRMAPPGWRAAGGGGGAGRGLGARGKAREAGRGCPVPPAPGTVRLALAAPGGAAFSRAGHAVGGAPAVELVEGGELVVRGRDDELAAGIGL